MTLTHAVRLLRKELCPVRGVVNVEPEEVYGPQGQRARDDPHERVRGEQHGVVWRRGGRRSAIASGHARVGGRAAGWGRNHDRCNVGKDGGDGDHGPHLPVEKGGDLRSVDVGCAFKPSVSLGDRSSSLGGVGWVWGDGEFVSCDVSPSCPSVTPFPSLPVSPSPSLSLATTHKSGNVEKTAASREVLR